MLIFSATATHVCLAPGVSLGMAGLLEVGKVFVDLHGRSKSSIFLELYRIQSIKTK